ncbi:MAG TPA: hypothetical protein VFW96_23775 [Thermomicrobiales bacterium]|nr:hypothetical protein [Thermomicrobiales bacterium]
MTHGASRAEVQDAITDYLDYLLQTWQGVPDTAAEWSEWDEYSRFVFAFDWDVPEDRLGQLKRWAAQGLFTPAQRARYDELLRLVERNRPILNALLAE